VTDRSANVTQASFKFWHFSDATYDYYGTALAGSLLTDPVWQIERIERSSGNTDHPDGDTNFDNVFTDLTTVAGLVYS